MKLKKYLFLTLMPFTVFANSQNMASVPVDKKLAQQTDIIHQQQKEITNLTQSLLLQKKQQTELAQQLKASQNTIQSLNKTMKNLQTIIAKLKNEQKNLKGLNQQLVQQQAQNENSITNLTGKLTNLDQSTQQLTNDYQAGQSLVTNKISAVNNQLTENQNSISNLGKNLNSQWIYGLIAILTFLLISLLSYLLLSKRIKKGNQTSLEMISQTRKSLEEETVKLDNKLVELLENQIRVSELESNSSNSGYELDHTLALKVADEIVRIQKNISAMDSGTKGLKQLSASVKRIQDNFLANGYELVDMLGKDYQEGMNAIANFVTSDELPAGVQRITRIIKPQVNYNGVMIQAAQIEVTIGE